MVKYTVAASVALVQLAMFTQTSVALPIEYTGGLESRAISSSDGQQLIERDDMELEARIDHPLLAGLAVGTATAVGLHELVQNQNQNQDPSSTDKSANRRRYYALDRRDLEDEVKNAAKNAKAKVGTIFHGNGAASGGGTTGGGTGGGGQERRDLYERDWDEYEKRSFNDFEERDWNEFEERDWDDYEMEARGLDFDELDELD